MNSQRLSCEAVRLCIPVDPLGTKWSQLRVLRVGLCTETGTGQRGTGDKGSCSGRSQWRPKGVIVWFPNLSSHNSPLRSWCWTRALSIPSRKQLLSCGSQSRNALMIRVWRLVNWKLEVFTLKETPLI